ncbi:hypothetical protein [Haloarcula japonica]|uniref:hypothetical protein n=1 Tax=Haloarcula japonica TaxID=29282 RepID=UPI0039F66F80
MLVTAWLVVTAGVGAGVTYGLLSDDATASGTIRIDVGSPAPSNGDAYNDANGNGRYDEGESTYSEDELVNFNDPSANLVIPEDIDSIEPDNSQVSIRAGAITYGGKIESDTSSISLTAVDGDISMDGSKLESTNGAVTLDAPNGSISLTDGEIKAETGQVTLSANEKIDLTDSEVKAENGNINITTSDELIADDTVIESETGYVLLRAETISAHQAEISADNEYVTLSATQNGGGPIDVTGTDLSANHDIMLESNGDVRATETTMETTNGKITADLGTTDATLYVDGATIDDGDDAIAYRPNGVRVVPSDGPATGS